ncbi:MAG: DUF342 domain-containing protein [Proteobacteria bacterium]|nr:DUF342 domain-containing protein [Pseudomonadota bacterium]MBU1387384.1 DUF342 domain-containing protein [Pseudomonadota bacterium]MBU1541669.1 DUF342 domain-containing protein [Pseudomonadota bacterium]MBU2482064.1 DUF342 domain-containing protein [Pseudomonadota bacterium]
MDSIQNSSQTINLSPERIKEKADILETNLYKSITGQEDPSKMQFRINRKNFPDPVIQKALLQLMPRFKVNPRDFLSGLRDLMNKKIEPSKEAIYKKSLANQEEALSSASHALSRTFTAIAAQDSLEIIVQGVAQIKSCNGEIAKSYFSHEKSPGKLLKDGVINFKEINNYPVVNAGDTLFYITYEKQGTQGLSFEGNIIPVSEAAPYAINIGDGVERIDDNSSAGKPMGYFLKARKTGVVTLERNPGNLITGIDILEAVEVKKLDYSIGNIGSQYTCPIRMKAGVVCNGFKIRVHGKVEADIVDGGEIITNNQAVIFKALADSTIMALKDITIDSSTRAKLISEQGTLTINTELIDSEISAPNIIFERNRGLITNNTIEAENLLFNGLYFSGENIIHFGNTLFIEKKEILKSKEKVQTQILELKNNEKLLMGQLQLELKRLTKLAASDPELVRFIKPLILATQTMDFQVINREMERIQARNNTRTVTQVKQIFESLEKLPRSMEELQLETKSIDDSLNQIQTRMAAMKITIEGYLRDAAIIKIFCGLPEEGKSAIPCFTIESEGKENRYIHIKGTYSSKKGFEFVQ